MRRVATKQKVATGWQQGGNAIKSTLLLPVTTCCYLLSEKNNGERAEDSMETVATVAAVATKSAVERESGNVCHESVHFGTFGTRGAL